LGACAIIDAIQPLWFETLLACVKYDGVFDVLVAGLVKSFGSICFLRLLLVHTWAWDITLIVVIVEDLIIMESR
jgi:hypothetical protein